MPSENVDRSNSRQADESAGGDATGSGGDRRTRKRLARRHHLLDVASELVERDGVEGLTMAALAEAADYAPASLYTYFSSRSALVAALQRRALVTLGEVAEVELARWDAALDGGDAGPEHAGVRSLARLWAFSELFLAAPTDHPREFRLQQELLVAAGAQELDDAVQTVPVAMVVLDVPRRLLADAVVAGALEPHPASTDPLGAPVDGAVVRTLAWLVALNGALLTDGLPTGLPSTGTTLGREITGALLRGWGAPRADLDRAAALADQIDRRST